jgi:WD40 repeat protein
LKLWDLLTHQLRFSLEAYGAGCHCVAFGPDGGTVAAGYDNYGCVKLWDVNRGRVWSALRGHPNAVWGLAYTAERWRTRRMAPCWPVAARMRRCGCGTQLQARCGDRIAKLWKAAEDPWTGPVPSR